MFLIQNLPPVLGVYEFMKKQGWQVGEGKTKRLDPNLHTPFDKFWMKTMSGKTDNAKTL